MAFSSVYRRLLGTYPGLPLQIAKSETNNAYNEAARKWEWIALEDDFTFTTATLSTSSTNSTYVTVDSGGTTVTLGGDDADADFNDTVADGSLTTLYHVRINGEPNLYEVSAVGSTGTTLTIPAYGGDTLAASDLASWEFFKYQYELGSTVREVLSVTHESLLEEISKVDLDRIDPERTSTSTTPTRWCKRGHTSSGYPIIEIWPRPSANFVVSYRARINVTALTSDSDTFLLDENLIYYTALINTLPIYSSLFPEQGKMLSGMVKLWVPQRESIYADLVQEDIRRHSSATKVRNTASGTSSTETYYGDDITSGYP